MSSRYSRKKTEPKNNITITGRTVKWLSIYVVIQSCITLFLLFINVAMSIMADGEVVSSSLIKSINSSSLLLGFMTSLITAVFSMWITKKHNNPRSVILSDALITWTLLVCNYLMTRMVVFDESVFQGTEHYFSSLSLPISLVGLFLVVGLRSYFHFVHGIGNFYRNPEIGSFIGYSVDSILVYLTLATNVIMGSTLNEYHFIYRAFGIDLVIVGGIASIIFVHHISTLQELIEKFTPITPDVVLWKELKTAFSFEVQTGGVVIVVIGLIEGIFGIFDLSTDAGVITQVLDRISQTDKHKSIRPGNDMEFIQIIQGYFFATIVVILLSTIVNFLFLRRQTMHIIKRHDDEIDLAKRYAVGSFHTITEDEIIKYEREAKEVLIVTESLKFECEESLDGRLHNEIDENMGYYFRQVANGVPIKDRQSRYRFIVRESKFNEMTQKIKEIYFSRSYQPENVQSDFVKHFVRTAPDKWFNILRPFPERTYAFPNGDVKVCDILEIHGGFTDIVEAPRNATEQLSQDFVKSFDEIFADSD